MKRTSAMDDVQIDEITPTYTASHDPYYKPMMDRTPQARSMRRIMREERRAMRAEIKKRSQENQDGSQLLTKKDVAARLQCSPRKVDTLAAEGRIPKTKIGRLVRFTPEAVDAYIRRQTSCEGT